METEAVAGQSLLHLAHIGHAVLEQRQQIARLIRKRVRTGCTQLLRRAESPGNTDGGQSCVYCGLHIGRAVADVEGRSLIAAQLVQQLQHACRIRLARDIRAFAIGNAHQIAEIVLNQRFRGGIVLIRQHTDRHAVLLERFEHRNNALIRMRAVHHVLAVERAEIRQTDVDHLVRAALFGNAALDQLAYAVADADARLLHAHRRKAVLLHGIGHAVTQITERVEQRTV